MKGKFLLLSFVFSIITLLVDLIECSIAILSETIILFQRVDLVTAKYFLPILVILSCLTYIFGFIAIFRKEPKLFLLIIPFLLVPLSWLISPFLAYLILGIGMLFMPK